MSSDDHITIPFDPEGESLPELLSDPVGDGGEVVALIADAALRESGWAARAAVALATRWAEAGHRILLMDANPVDPSLHTLLDESNGEGVNDAVLYGVSPARMARSRDEGFLFASAGTVTSDASTVLRHPRWASVLSACRGSGSRVILFLPAGVPGTEGLADEADRVIRLKTVLAATSGGGPGGIVLHPPRSGRMESTAEASGSAPLPGSSSATPGPGVSMGSSDVELLDTATPGSHEGGGEPGPERGAAEGSTERGETSPEPAAGDPPPAAGPSPTADTASPPPPAGQPSSGGRRSTWLLIALIALAVLLFIAALLGLIDIPGITPEAAAAHQSERVSANP